MLSTDGTGDTGDALAGHFDDVVRTGERFRAGWERAGRPVARNLARTSYAVAMVHGMFSAIASWEYRPWYAALWAEAAVLDHHPSAAARVERSRHAARDNPIASAIVERAAAVAAGDRSAVQNLAATFARLRCPYQEARTRTLVRMTPGR